MGEVFYYNGLKESLSFNNDNFGFPEGSKYRIVIYEVNDVGGLNEVKTFYSEENLASEEEGVGREYVLDWSSSKLRWDIEKIERKNIIINIRVW